ncbi:MAG: hypothetical protein LBJ08_09660 [Bifidobacteriaceae bacterium]|jgi:hypothetical protein|nr:hypothetical protein [Bifidobacteriaceae bacterium]
MPTIAHPPAFARTLLSIIAAASLLTGAGCTEADDDVATLETQGASTPASPRVGQSEGAEPAETANPAGTPDTESGERKPDDPDAPSGPAAAPSDYDAAQSEAAREFHSCLTAAEVPVELFEDEGSGVHIWPVGGAWILTLADGYSQRGGGTDGKAISVEEQRAFQRDHQGENALVIDGKDYSGPWDQCRESSGYFLYGPPEDPAEEMIAKQREAEATNTWIACARENGYPGLADVTATANSWPRALLPFDIADEALSALMTACPPVDADAYVASPQPDGQPLALPGIGFEGQDEIWAADDAGEDHPDLGRLTKLRKLVDGFVDDAIDQTNEQMAGATKG